MNSQLTRRTILGGSIATAAACSMPASRSVALRPAVADIELEISSHRLELAPGVLYNTFAYNGSVPGPVVRLDSRREYTVNVTNQIPVREFVHWHGFTIPSDVDGAAEEGTAAVHPFRSRSYTFTPTSSGTHWYHTHMIAMKALMFGAYSGLFGFAIIDDPQDPGDYDQEVLVAMHHWGSHWTSGSSRRPNDPNHGFEVGYNHATMNGRMLGHGDPVRVKKGERVLFRLLNASATEITWTRLAGHSMEVVAMDGKPVPRRAHIEMLMLGPGERADVIVTMDNPGKWIFGARHKKDRDKGMGMIVEYAHATGDPQWDDVKPQWDFGWFAGDSAILPPDEVINMDIDKIAGGPTGFNRWMINGKSWPDTDRIRLQEGKRYRLVLNNKSNEGHPIHLHRHHFEVASYSGTPCPGLMKDTINIRPHSTTELDFVADNPGPTLMHCHQAKHQDFGLMALFLYENDLEPHFQPDATHAAIDRVFCGGRLGLG